MAELNAGAWWEKYQSIVKYVRGVLFSRFGISRGGAGCSSAPGTWVLWEYLRGKQTAGSEKHYHHPTSDRQTPKQTTKKKKKKKKTTRFQTKKKHFAKTEYLMVNLAGQTTLVVHNTTVFFLAQSTPSTCQSFDGVLCNVIQYVLFKTENLRTLWTLVFFFFHAFHHQAFSFLFTSLLAIYSLFVSTRLSFIVAMQLYLPFRQKRENLQKGLGCLIVRMVGQPEWYG